MRKVNCHFRLGSFDSDLTSQIWFHRHRAAVNINNLNLEAARGKKLTEISLSFRVQKTRLISYLIRFFFPMLASQKIIIIIAGGLVKKESYLKLPQSTLHGNVASFLVFQLHSTSARTCITQNGEGAHFNTTYICIVSRLSQNQVESEASYMALLVNQGSI